MAQGGIGQRDYRDAVRARTARAITPSDTTDLSLRCARVVTGVSGNLRVLTDLGEDVTIPQAIIDKLGGVVDLEVVRVFATGTTATTIWGFFY